MLLPAAAELRLPPSAQKPIVEGALVFLQLLDRGRPLEARAITTRYFRSRIDPQRWEQLYRRQRQPLGRLQSRQLAGYQYHNSFEAALEGLYLQVRFRSDFAARSDLVERVEMYKDYDGRWRVIGYYIEPGG